MTVQPQYAETDIWGNDLTEAEQAWLDQHAHEILPEPFAHYNWKTGDSRDRWEDMSGVPDASDESEWLSVLDDRTPRKAAIIHVDHRNRDRWLERVGRHGLAYRQIRWTKSYDGFAHRIPEVDPDDPERMSYAVIAENEDVADKMVEAELELRGPERHEAVGELLGFPDCCREFFADVWVEQGIVDPMYEIACNSGNAEVVGDDPEVIRIVDPEPWANVLYRYWGWVYVTHMPCGFDCEASIEIGKQRGEIMAENGYRDEANRLWEWMREPMTWTSVAGQCQVKNRHFLGASGSSQYWSRKTIIWDRPHANEWRRPPDTDDIDDDDA